MKTLFLVVFFAIIMVSPVNAQSTLHLQEKCAGGARDLFVKEEYLKDSPGIIWTYTNHYNKKLDKCFILLQGFRSEKDEKEVQMIKLLYDVFEGKNYANYFAPVSDENRIKWGICFFEGNKCFSLKEFEALIKPYMED